MKKIVIDKYTPVRTNFEGYTPPSIAIVGAWICALFLSLFFAPDLHIYAQGQNAQVRDSLSQGTSVLQKISQTVLPQDQNALNPAMQRIYNQEYRLGTQLEPIATIPHIPPQKMRSKIPKRILILGSSSMYSTQGAYLSKLLQRADLKVDLHAKVVDMAQG